MWWRDFLTIQWVVFRDQHPNKQSKSGESSNALYLLALQGKQYHFCNFVNIRRQSLRLVIFLRVNIRRQVTQASHCSRRRQWQTTPVHLPGKSHGWRSLVGCSPREANVIPPCNRVNVSTCLKVKDMFSMSSSKFWIVSGLKEAQRMLGRSRSQTQVLQLRAGSFTLISCQPVINRF